MAGLAGLSARIIQRISTYLITSLMQTQTGQRIAVIGAGWAGCAAASRLADAGFAVTLIEASRTLGGRARRVMQQSTQQLTQHTLALDNGQHILLGAYSETLALMQRLGVDTDAVLLKLPLQMIYPPNTGGMRFLAPRLPAPWHLLAALLGADGLSAADRLALARFSSAARWMGWQLHQDCAVTELLERFDQTARLCRLMWYPLCLAALNTAPERASAKVFLNVLRDSLGAQRAASDMLLPRVDLSALLPDASAQFLQTRYGTVLPGVRIQGLHQLASGRWQLFSEQAHEALAGEWDAVIIATPANQANHLLQGLTFADAPSSYHLPVLPAFEHEAITTCYLQYPPTLTLPRPFFALLDQVDQPEQRQWGQFVFDRGQLNAEQAGLMAVVVSASGYLNRYTHSELAHDMAQQLAQQFCNPAFAQPLWHQVITEKRATFACTPNLQRPDNATGVPNLLIAGDYTAGDYPATLEAAVRSGNSAAQCMITWLDSKDKPQYP